jgi:Fe2+ transport system protein FeoA
MTDPTLFLPGSECEIRSLGANDKTAQRLAQMGVLPGSRLKIIRTAPFGETLEVASDQGEYFALRGDEIASLDCRLVAAPLISPAIQPMQPYRILTLRGGKTFRQRMADKHLTPGNPIQVEKTGPYRIRVTEAAHGTTIDLGHGKAEKIIVELRQDAEPA